eukprot:s52_g11.t1
MGKSRRQGTGGSALVSVRLHNPHNLCYLNSGVMAMVHAMQGLELPRGIRQLRDAVLQNRGGILNLASHFGLRNVFQGWPLNNRQRDAAEFTNFVLNQVDLRQAVWEAREFGRGAHNVIDAGSGMLYLELPSSDCDIQELVSAWSFQAQTHALATRSEYVLLQLGRFPHVRVRFHQQVRVPVFSVGIDCEWETYFVIAGIVHYGETPLSGHYRAILRVQDDWWLTDDDVVAAADRQPLTMAEQLEAPMEQEEELRIWNAFKQAAPTALTGQNEEDPLDKDRANKFRKPDGKGDTRGSERDEGRLSKGQGQGQGRQREQQQSRGSGQWGSNHWGDGYWTPKGKEVDLQTLKAMVSQLAKLEMTNRLTHLREDKERRASMEKLGWLQNDEFQRLRWDAKLKKNVRDDEASAISYDAVISTLQSMQTKCNTVEALLRFHPTRPLTEQMQEGTVAFLLQFSLQTDSGLAMYSEMCSLCEVDLMACWALPVRRQIDPLFTFVDLVMDMTSLYFCDGAVLGVFAFQRSEIGSAFDSLLLVLLGSCSLGLSEGATVKVVGSRMCHEQLTRLLSLEQAQTGAYVTGGTVQVLQRAGEQPLLAGLGANVSTSDRQASTHAEMIILSDSEVEVTAPCKRRRAQIAQDPDTESRLGAPLHFPYRSMMSPENVAAACRAMARTKFFDGDILRDLNDVLKRLLQRDQLSSAQVNDALQCLWEINAYDQNVLSAIASTFKGKLASLEPIYRQTWREIFEGFKHDRDKDFRQLLETPPLTAASPGYQKIRCFHHSKGFCAVGDKACTYSHDPRAPLTLEMFSVPMRASPLVMTQNQYTMGRTIYGGARNGQFAA